MSSDAASDGPDDLVRNLQERAWHTNLRRAEELDRLVGGLGQAIDPAGAAAEVSHRWRDLRERARTVAHELVGSAGTFGYPEASDAARALEGRLAGLEVTEPVGPLGELVARIRDALGSAPAVELE